MKRLLTLVLALAMVLSLAACGSKKTVQLTADGGAVVVLSADANNAVTSLSVAFRKQLAAKLGGEVQLNYDNKLDEKASGTRVLIGQTSQAASTALYAQLAQAGKMFFGGGESPFGRQLPHVQFIDHRRITPCGMRNMCRFVHFYPIQTAKIGKFGNIRNILLFNPSRGGLSEKK